MTTFAFSLGQLPFLTDQEKGVLMEYQNYVDSVGIHIYSRVPGRFFGYITAGETDFHRAESWRREAEKAGKDVWLTEVQGEPYEKGNAVHIKQRSYPSFDPERMIDLVSDLTVRGFQKQLLWGVEHWLWHEKQGHPEWVNAWNKLQEAPLLKAA